MASCQSQRHLVLTAFTLVVIALCSFPTTLDPKTGLLEQACLVLENSNVTDVSTGRENNNEPKVLGIRLGT